jgi:ribosomal protein L11 methyltransferase
VPGAPALTLRFPHDDPAIRDLAAAEIHGTDATAIHDADDSEWRVFFPTPSSRADAETTLEPFCRTHGIAIGRIDVDDEGWARRSQAALTAVRIGDIIVAPPWDLPTGRGTSTEARPEDRGTRSEVLIVIEPSLGFGTGHHASTRLCLRAMQALDLRGKSVIDVGTGSGVLAIAAVKLGAARVTAIDTDADAVASARENGARNEVAVDWQTADVAAADRSYLRDRHASPAFDVVLANLTGAWLRRLAGPLLGLAGGTLVLSGLQTSERDRVLESFAGSSRLERELDEEGWTAFVMVHNYGRHSFSEVGRNPALTLNGPPADRRNVRGHDRAAKAAQRIATQ